MTHDTNVKVYYTHETNTSLITDHMTTEKDHQAARKYLDILKDGSRYKMWVDRWPSFRTAKVYSGALVG